MGCAAGIAAPGWTPPHCEAAGNGGSDVERATLCNSLLNEPIRMGDAFERTPLHAASSDCVVVALLVSGADVAARDDHGASPLGLEMRRGCTSACIALLAAAQMPARQTCTTTHP